MTYDLAVDFDLQEAAEAVIQEWAPATRWTATEVNALALAIAQALQRVRDKEREMAADEAREKEERLP